MKKNILVLMLGLLVTTVAFSQREKKKRHQPNPALKKEMHSYIESNVVPVLKVEQNKFDRQLSADDLAFIQAKRELFAKKRAEKKAEHEAHRVERKAMREKLKNMTEEERDDFRKEKMEQRKSKHGESKEERKAMKAEMKEFMKRNETLIKNTMTALKPNYETWTSEQKAIFEKYKPADAPAMKEGRRKGRVGLFGLEMRRGKHHKKGRRGHHESDRRKDGETKKDKKHHERRNMKLAMQFVLWDGTVPTPPAERREDAEQKVVLDSDANIMLGQNYPNPATGMTRIDVEIPTGVSQLDLTVTDMNGKVVKRLNLTNLSVGKESIELDVSDLSNGQYFYTVEAEGIKASKKMVVNH